MRTFGTVAPATLLQEELLRAFDCEVTEARKRPAKASRKSVTCISSLPEALESIGEATLAHIQRYI